MQNAKYKKKFVMHVGFSKREGRAARNHGHPAHYQGRAPMFGVLVHKLFNSRKDPHQERAPLLWNFTHYLFCPALLLWGTDVFQEERDQHAIFPIIHTSVVQTLSGRTDIVSGTIYN